MFWWVCVGGECCGSVECVLHGGAAACLQATAIVQAKEGEACAKWCEGELSGPKASLALKLQEGPNAPTLRFKCLLVSRGPWHLMEPLWTQFCNNSFCIANCAVTPALPSPRLPHPTGF